MFIKKKIIQYANKLVDTENLKSDLVNKRYDKIKTTTIQFQYIVSILVYLIIIDGYYKADYYPLMTLTIVSMAILIFFFILKWNKPLSTNLSSTLFIYIPITNIFCKDVFFLLNRNVEIKTIFLHTHFMLLLFISFGGLVSNHRNILYIGGISVIWIWIFTICLNDSYLWSLIVLDTVFFIGISLVIYRTYTLLSIFYTKLRKLLHTLDQQNEELNNLIKLKNWMLNMIVHDIKNPINRILSASEMDIIQKEEITQPSKHILTIVENILDVYKMEDSELSLKLTIQNIETIIKESYENVEYLLNNKKITLKQIISANFIVEVDVGLLVRVFVNLLTNSIKFSKTNSCIEIRVMSKNNKVRVEIQDNGIGIASKNIDHIFEKHYQVNARNLGNTRSTGIGLTFCKLVIESHGGTIGAESKLNAWTTVWFELPLISEHKLICEEITKAPLKKYRYSQADKDIMLQYKLKLANLAIYKTSEICNIFKENPCNSPQIVEWKEDIIKSSIAGDIANFNELTKIAYD